MGALDMAWFPWVEEGRGSASSLVCNPEYYKPSRDDVLIYMTAQAEDMNAELNRVEEVGEKIIQHKTLIAEGYGFMAIFIDTEGNRIALHSRK